MVKPTISDKRSSGVRKAIGLAGGVKALADKLDVHPTSVGGWTEIPIRHVMTIEGLFPGRITPHEMRPDYFGPEQ